MNMYMINLENWKFGGDRSRNEIWTKNSLSGHGDFFSKIWQKNHRFQDLEEIWWRFGTSKYLVIWTFEQLDEYSRHPMIMGACRNLSICSNVQITKYLDVPNLRQISSKSRILWFFCKNLEEKSPCPDRLLFVQISFLLRSPPNFQSFKFIIYIFIH